MASGHLKKPSWTVLGLPRELELQLSLQSAMYRRRLGNDLVLQPACLWLQSYKRLCMRLPWQGADLLKPKQTCCAWHYFLAFLPLAAPLPFVSGSFRFVDCFIVVGPKKASRRPGSLNQLLSVLKLFGCNPCRSKAFTMIQAWHAPFLKASISWFTL